jgi:alkaline phosphatase D
VTSDNLDDILGTPPRTASLAVENGLVANNPHVKYLDFDSHGFSVFEVTPAGAQMDWFVLTDRTDPGAGAVWSTSWRVPAGSRRLERAAGRLA